MPDPRRRARCRARAVSRRALGMRQPRARPPRGSDWRRPSRRGCARALALLHGRRGPTASLGFETLERFRAPENDQLVAAVNQRVRLRIELHVPVLALDPDDDDAEPLAEARVDKRAIG